MRYGLYIILQIQLPTHVNKDKLRPTLQSWPITKFYLRSTFFWHLAFFSELTQQQLRVQVYIESTSLWAINVLITTHQTHRWRWFWRRKQICTN